MLTAVISEPCGILPAQADDMSPDSAFVIAYILMHLSQHHRNACIGKQAMFTDSLHTGTASNVLHIIFPLTDEVEILFQGKGDEFGSIADGGVLTVISVLQHIFGRRNVME